MTDSVAVGLPHATGSALSSGISELQNLGIPKVQNNLRDSSVPPGLRKKAAEAMRGKPKNTRFLLQNEEKTSKKKWSVRDLALSPITIV